MILSKKLKFSWWGVGLVVLMACGGASAEAPWESVNPLKPIPDPPLGIGINEDYATLTEFPDPPTPESVRLGRWLFFDKRLSADRTISCATCHRPENAFSEPVPTSTGIRGQVGTRKAPSFVNQAWTIYPHFFWDGRAASLEDQAGGPMVNPIEMGNEDHDVVVERVAAIEGYAAYFEETFGTPEVTLERITRAIADYERTRMSGNSPWDQWREAIYTDGDEDVVSDEVKLGHELFFGRARCNNCHFGQNFTDNTFHNLGFGWDPETQTFKDEGRFAVTGDPNDLGAFKTPSLRDLSVRAPYLHDGSVSSLREIVEHYNQGGTPNPNLDPKISFETSAELNLTEEEISALVAFMEALNGEGYEDTAPESFPPDSLSGGDTGTLSGRVGYEGRVPVMQPISMSMEPHCDKMHAENPATTEWLIVGPDRGLANVFVHVVNGLPEGAEYPLPEEPAVLTQEGCVYSPHVFAVRAGQPLRVLNPDGVLHNIHPKPNVNREFNKSMNANRKEISHTFTAPEPMFPIQCDVHTWMGAHMAVMDHPFYAVTDETGAFTIDGLPPGDYEVEFWHERLGAHRAEISVTAGQETRVDQTMSIAMRNARAEGK